MSGNRRHHERAVKREALLQKDQRDALARGVAVNRAALAPHNSYSPPEIIVRGYYVDVPFNCQTCGKPQIWTASQQKWWYEVAKGSVFSTATECRACRQQKKKQGEQGRAGGGDPNRYKDAGLLIARVRSEIEPGLLAAGFRPAGRNRRGARRALFIDYNRSDDLFTLSWDQHRARLTAELLTDGGCRLKAIAAAEFSGARSTADIEARLVPFMDAVRRFLEELSAPGRQRKDPVG
jgi:hypothetical protein